MVEIPRTAKQLASLLRRGEGMTLEFKRSTGVSGVWPKHSPPSAQLLGREAVGGRRPGAEERVGGLVEQVERDLQGDMEGGELLGAKATDVVGEGAFRKADQAIAMDGARALQSLRLADRDLGAEAVTTRGNGRADDGAVFGCVAEHLPADNNEYPGSLGLCAGGVGDAVQVSASHGMT